MTAVDLVFKLVMKLATLTFSQNEATEQSFQQVALYIRENDFICFFNSSVLSDWF